jgi:hypothetical protein
LALSSGSAFELNMARFFVKLCQKVHGVDFLQERRSRLSGDQFSPLKRSSPSSGSKVVMTPWFFTKCSVSV